jgi:hypothetical protein
MHQSAAMCVFPGFLFVVQNQQKGKSMKTSGQINPEGSEYFCVRHAG